MATMARRSWAINLRRRGFNFSAESALMAAISQSWTLIIPPDFCAIDRIVGMGRWRRGGVFTLRRRGSRSGDE